MQLGILGAGRIGANHARILSTLTAVDRLLHADVAPDRAEQLAASLPEPQPADLEAVFDTAEAS